MPKEPKPTPVRPSPLSVSTTLSTPSGPDKSKTASTAKRRPSDLSQPSSLPSSAANTPSGTPSPNLTPSAIGTKDDEVIPSLKSKEKEKEKEDEEDSEEEEDIETATDRVTILKSDQMKEHMRILLANFSEDQLQRFESYRRATFGEATIKRVLGNILQQPINKQTATVARGFCKVFVGEMVERARQVMTDWNERGPIRPQHLREAYRRYKEEENGLAPNSVAGKSTKRLF
ncbi:hTAFII28-like protein conserved region-domain-containing protein [Paraphysoderma sedebokerense]|nr:hTAFII28-like protein conserved region-domain-containing protein [Paraphysoderma sedebokerense]